MSLDLLPSTDAAPSAATPQENVSLESVAQDSLPQNSLPQESLPQDSLPSDGLPQDDLPSDSAEAAGPFADVPSRLRPALEARGFKTLTSVQAAVLDAEVEGRDLQISSQTGSGKTVALGFVLASPLEAAPSGKGPLALIIVPTRELATQVCKELTWLFAEIPGVRVASVTGGNPAFRDRQLLARRPQVLVGTPGRLLDHVKTRKLDLSNVRELVLDEADEMLDMGFREELEGILDSTPETRRTHMVSATFPTGIQSLAHRYQRNPFAIEGTRLGEANRDIVHEGHLVQPQNRYAALVNLLLRANGDKTLVFVQQRAETTDLASRLEADGFAALPLSGELAHSQRVSTLAAFRAGRATVLVATDVAARGLDVPDVRTVIHTALPLDAQVYTHRSGRTGRAGMRGRSVLLAAPNRRRRVARILSDAGVELNWRPVPSAADVRAHLAASARKELEKDLEVILADGAPPEQLEHAEQLLAEGRDPAQLVAALLTRLQPARRVEPNVIETPRVSPDRGRHERPHRDRTPRDLSSPSRNGLAPKPNGGRSGDMVRFFVNWGVNQGAKPNRLLAAICRRGNVKGTDIGSIAIHPNASTFDVSAQVAERFERLASRRDPRDPRTRIRRDRSVMPSSGPFSSKSSTAPGPR